MRRALRSHGGVAASFLTSSAVTLPLSRGKESVDPIVAEESFSVGSVYVCTGF